MQTDIRNMLLASVIAATIVPAITGAQADTTLVIQGARIVPGNGPVIERGNVIIQNDRIASVGPENGAPIPTGAQVVDGKGLTVYPGLLDAFCLAGVAAPPRAPGAPQQPGGPRGGGGGGGRQGRNGGFTPPAPAPLTWRKATEGFDAKSAALAALRNNGYTAALFGTRGVLTPGEDSLLALSPGDPATNSATAPSKMMLQDRAATNVNTLSRGFSTYPSTLMGAFGFLRQAFYDAVDSRNHPPAKPDPRLDTLAAAAEGKIPVFYTANSENDIKRALRLGTEFNLRILILGGKEAEKVIPQLLADKAAVVLTDDWTPALALAKAEVPFALASNKTDMSAGEANDLRDRARALVEKGLPADTVLAALTRVPAGLLGVGDRLGSVAPGQLADMVVTEGDLWSKTAKIRFVIVNGRRVDPTPVKAEDGPRPQRLAADGVAYTNVTEDDADNDGGDR